MGFARIDKQVFHYKYLLHLYVTPFYKLVTFLFLGFALSISESLEFVMAMKHLFAEIASSLHAVISRPTVTFKMKRRTTIHRA